MRARAQGNATNAGREPWLGPTVPQGAERLRFTAIERPRDYAGPRTLLGLRGTPQGGWPLAFPHPDGKTEILVESLAIGETRLHEPEWPQGRWARVLAVSGNLSPLPTPDEGYRLERLVFEVGLVDDDGIVRRRVTSQGPCASSTHLKLGLGVPLVTGYRLEERVGPTWGALNLDDDPQDGYILIGAMRTNRD